MKKLTSILILVLLAVIGNACASTSTPAVPTSTVMPFSTLAFTFTPTSTSTPTFTITPLPSSTASPGFQRISLKSFVPLLSVDLPISVEIPQDYVTCNLGSLDTTWWGPPQCDPDTTSFFLAYSPINGQYDYHTDKFIGVPNDINDDLISKYEQFGEKINRVERRNIGEFPVLILELELVNQPGPEALRYLVNWVLIATHADTEVVKIEYYFPSLTISEKEAAVWKHFESSLERNP